MLEKVLAARLYNKLAGENLQTFFYFLPPGSNPCTFVMPERCLEGYLLKANRKHVWQKRYIILNGRYMSYFKDPSVSSTSSVHELYASKRQTHANQCPLSLFYLYMFCPCYGLGVVCQGPSRDIRLFDSLSAARR